MSSQYKITTAKAGNGQPQKLYAYNTALLLPAFGACGALAVFSVFGKGYNILWLAGSCTPFLTSLVYNHSSQPFQHLQNCYSYIVAKR